MQYFRAGGGLSAVLLGPLLIASLSAPHAVAQPHGKGSGAPVSQGETSRLLTSARAIISKNEVQWHEGFLEIAVLKNVAVSGCQVVLSGEGVERRYTIEGTEMDAFDGIHSILVSGPGVGDEGGFILHLTEPGAARLLKEHIDDIAALLAPCQKR